MKGKMNPINKERPIQDIQYYSRKETEEKVQKQIMLMYGIFCLQIVVSGLVALCVTNDFLRQRKTWNIVETSNPTVVFITALTCAMLLNVSMLYFGIELKKYSQKMCKKSEVKKVGILSCTTFLITYTFYFMFTLATKNSAYSMRKTGVFQLGGTLDATESSEKAILYIALYAAFLPFSTSTFSVLAGYCSSNPLQRLINILRLRRIDTQNNLMDVSQALEEVEEPLVYARYLQKVENDKYKTFVESIRLHGLCCIIQTAELIARKIDTPEAYSELIVKTKEYVDSYKSTSEMPHESLDFIINELYKDGVNNSFIKEVTRKDSDYVIDSIEEGRSSV